MSSPSSSAIPPTVNSSSINASNTVSSSISTSSISTSQTSSRVTFCDKVKAWFIKTGAPAINAGVTVANNIEPVIETIETVTGHPQFVPASRAAMASINALNSGIQNVAGNMKNNTVNAKATINTVVTSTSTAISDLQKVIAPTNTQIPKVLDEIKQVSDSITQ